MNRFHVHLHVDDIATSIAFYSKLFAVQPARVEADCAKWMLDDPRIDFALSTRGTKPGVDHLGARTDDADALAELKARAEAADLTLLDEGEVTWCYARSDKRWLTDPQDIAWEHFRGINSIPVYSERAAPVAGEMASACCAAKAPFGRPVGIAVKPASTCC